MIKFFIWGGHSGCSPALPYLPCRQKEFITAMENDNHKFKLQERRCGYFF
ncbi:Uncharacterized protein dnl_56220 [Desulfonema limicola]|uniref:Uncharacterized protein n=1 Tax=Desulfonema limicola TaxID=45656 RepID=A0A975BD88_9BACT|nr:Uncharacterized protein dnl_56220 [Desulfonema limicola]